MNPDYNEKSRRSDKIVDLIFPGFSELTLAEKKEFGVKLAELTGESAEYVEKALSMSNDETEE